MTARLTVEDMITLDRQGVPRLSIAQQAGVHPAHVSRLLIRYVGPKNGRQLTVSTTIDYAEVRRLVAEGNTDNVVAGIIGCAPYTIRTWRCRNGFARSPGRRPGKPSHTRAAA